MERISHWLSFNFVVEWEHIPPVKIVNGIFAILLHIYLVMQTEKVLAQNEKRAKQNQDTASFTIYMFVCSVNDKEAHVAQVVNTV